jgi:two-component system, NtrC family, sensor histidine kinase HydH
MRWRSDFWRFFAPTALMSLALASLCASGAVYLYRQQLQSADVLGENIKSRGAAGDLEETLHDLIALHNNQVAQVEPILDRVRAHLSKIAEYADKPEEKQLSAQAAESFERYLSARENASGEARPQALTVLEAQLLPVCEKLRRFNAVQVDVSEEEHRRALRGMTWGLAGVGLVASMSGLVLGYGVMRGLRRSIHQLRVRVQDAADKLGPELPPVVWSEGSLDELQDRMRGVVAQIEEIVLTLQQREREVLRAEQLAAVGQLAAGVAHEIRNPLTSIKLLVQAGREGGDAGLPSDDLAVIEHEIRRMERTLQTFIDFARPPRLERSRHNLGDLVNRALKLVQTRAAKQAVAIRFEPPLDPVESDVDGSQLQQVLINLILNALDVMPNGGQLDVRLEHGAGDVQTITVRDNGPGIAAGLLPRLFEPFISSKQTGLGLGLVVSKRIVEEHGGTLRGGNRPEGGAAFVVRLPPSGSAA